MSETKQSLVFVMQQFWAEQKLSAEEISRAEELLGRLAMHSDVHGDSKVRSGGSTVGKDRWEVQPWFLGPGSKVIQWLVSQRWPTEKISRLPLATARIL